MTPLTLSRPRRCKPFNEPAGWPLPANWMRRLCVRLGLPPDFLKPVLKRPLRSCPRHLLGGRCWNTCVFFDSQPARVVLHVTARFRDDMPPTDWINHLTTDPDARNNRPRLEWEIDRVEMGNATATVYVRSQVRVEGVEQLQLEEFSLVRSPAALWLIDAWHRYDTSN